MDWVLFLCFIIFLSYRSKLKMIKTLSASKNTHFLGNQTRKNAMILSKKSTVLIWDEYYKVAQQGSLKMRSYYSPKTDGKFAYYNFKMIANFHSAQHLQDHSLSQQLPVFQHPLQLEQAEAPSRYPSETHSQRARPEKPSEADGGGARGDLMRLMVSARLERAGLSSVGLEDIINRQLLKTKDLSSLVKSQLIQISQHVAREVVQAEGQARQMSPGVAKIGRERKFTRQSSVLTYRQQNNRVQSSGIPQEFTIFQCQICSQQRLYSSQEKCGHKFCCQCLQNHLRQNIINGTFIISCPQQNCQEKLSLQMIQKLLQEHEYNRFILFHQKSLDEQDPNNKFCSKADCGSILQRLDSKVSCKTCKEIYCGLCYQPEHPATTTCDAMKDTLDLPYQEFNIKKCPKCACPIEKDYGCNHLQCHKCKHQFCWICLKKYTPRHYKYYNCFGCPGMQFESQSQLCLQKFLKVVLYMFIPFLALAILLCYLSVVPLYIIFNLITKPFTWIYDKCDYLQANIIQKSCCCLLYFDFGDFVCNFLLWILYQPRAVIFSMFVSPMRLGSLLLAEIDAFFQ